MPTALSRAAPSAVCRRCLGAKATAKTRSRVLHGAPYSSRSNQTHDEAKPETAQKPSSAPGGITSQPEKPEQGAMSRRLEEATQEALMQGGTAGRRAVEDAGFSDDLKERLLDKIAASQYRNQFSDPLLQADDDRAASSVGEGTRHIASAKPWTGDEKVEDTVLRMLDDAKKPLKPGSRGKYQPPPVDSRLKRSPILSPGQRGASARDKASLYSGMDMKNDGKGLSEKEKEEMKREFRERFQPASRSVPVTVSGIAALANERIENAIARGQFKDLPRGKAMERDPRADNPFIDTTEYILNKMIQRQEIVPPWIEKQQELVKAARVFRTRLRNDWKRHCARMMASEGGSLGEQMKRAEEYAIAEETHNPLARSVDELAVPTTSTDDPVMAQRRQRAETIADANPAVLRSAEGRLSSTPFRDLAWERAEHAYMTLAVENLNSIARSYNLMAPDLAKKPYFSLTRELAACYAEVAPLVANEIKQRAVGGSLSSLGGKRARGGGDQVVGVSEGGDPVRIHLEAEEKAYGLKEWWKDFWKKG